MATLVLLRHGSTVWGSENRFAGWGDTPLSEAGLREAHNATALLRRQRTRFDVAFTSRLLRARQTMEIIAEKLHLAEDAVRSDWRLNERHYGALQGEDRETIIRRYGKEAVSQWRRTYHARPPELAEDDPRLIEQIERLPEIPRSLQPRTESMAEGALRALPVWTEQIAPALLAGHNVLLVAHTSPIRAIVSAVERLDDAQSEALRFATAVPKRYKFDADLTPTEGRHLIGGIGDGLRLVSKKRRPK